jgi:hypothetical protein
MSEFYVGYLPIPPGLKRFGRRVVAVLGAFAVGIGITLTLTQPPFAASAFEFHEYHDFQGTLVTDPFPALVVPDGLPWLLVGAGKHGFRPPAGLDGRAVRIRGERILPRRARQAKSPSRSTSAPSS